MVEPVTLNQLRHKPKADIVATVDFLERLDKATVAAFLKEPSSFTPVTIKSLPSGRNHIPSGGPGQGGPGPSANGCGPAAPTTLFLAPNSRNNCFYNAAIVCTPAAIDGQALLSQESSTPSAKVFFSAVDVVRHDRISGRLPRAILVSASTMLPVRQFPSPHHPFPSLTTCVTLFLICFAAAPLSTNLRQDQLATSRNIVMNNSGLPGADSVIGDTASVFEALSRRLDTYSQSSDDWPGTPDGRL